MLIKKYIKVNKINRFLCIVVCVPLCLGICACSDSRTDKASDRTPEEIEERFKEEDEMCISNTFYRYNGFDIREMEDQVEGFWDYYENYLESRRELEEVIENWEADFLEEGIYEVGKDILAGVYVFCDSDDPTDSAEENTIETHENASSLEEYGWNYIVLSPYFEYFELEDGEIIKITGHPKVAPVEMFPEDKSEKEGVYYGTTYKIGEEIQEGEYFVLSMDIENGYTDVANSTISEDARYIYSSDGATLENTQSIFSRYARNRFGYFRVEGEGYVDLEDCILISMDHKPKIYPVYHENISYLNGNSTWVDILDTLLRIKHHAKDYEQPVYVQGEYKIGEDIPIGTYQIQNEIACAISDRDSEEYHSDDDASLGDGRYSWTGLVIPYQDMAEQCGWQYIRTGTYGYAQQVKRMAANGEASYMLVTGGELPTVTFTKEDEGCVVRLVRVILVPEEAG